MTATLQLSAPIRQNIRNRGWDGKPSRTLKTEWALSEPTINSKGETSQWVIRLSTSHDVNRKRFVSALIRLEKLSGGSGFDCEKWQPFRDLVHLTQVSCARFSSKALEAAHAEAVAAFESPALQDNIKVQALLAIPEGEDS